MGEIVESKSEAIMCAAWEEEEEEEAKVEIWKYIFGFVEMAVIKCAIELGIADVIESHGSPMTLSEISSSALGAGCDISLLNRIMRFLTNRKIFRVVTIKGENCYAQTPLSRRLIMRKGEHSMAALLLLESSPVMLAPWHSLSARLLNNNGAVPPPFQHAHDGQDVWRYAQSNLEHSHLINEAMACDANHVMPAILQHCSEAFHGITSLVDVGGGNGAALSFLAAVNSSIQRLINFDVPHVIAAATPKCPKVEYVAGNMFQTIPKADAAFLMWVLHDWGDEDCIQILKNCREVIPKENGRVIIVEAVIGEGGGRKHKGLKDAGLMLDMLMMVHTDAGKERTLKEWEYVIKMAGFSTFTIKHIHAVQSVIIAYS